MSSDSLAKAADIRHFDRARVLLALRHLAQADGPPWLHGEVARRMAERLHIILARPEAVLDWWGLAGAGQSCLEKAYPQARRLVVEPTPALRERSVQAARPPWWSPRRFSAPDIQVLAPDEVPPASVQLVWANMMLHAVADPTRVLSLWQQALSEGGFVMFSCMGPDSLRELRDLYQAKGWPPAMAELVDMHDLGDMLVRAGFENPVMDQETLQLSWPDAESLLRELKSWGGNAAPERFQGLRTPAWRRQLLAALDSLRRADGRIHMRVELAYGHAFKGAPRPARPQQTSVSLDEMRALVRNRDARD